MRVATPQVALLLVILQLAVMVQPILSSASTAPAFLWSPKIHHEFSNNRMSEAVNYQTLSLKNLAKSVLNEGGWSNFLCSEKKAQRLVDLAIVFVGSELRSSDITANRHADPALVDLLKVSFTTANFSMAFPYVDASGKETIENLLVSGFEESCGHDLGISNGAYLGSCFDKNENFHGLSPLQSINDLASRIEDKPKGQTDLLVICHEDSHSSEEPDKLFSESKILYEVLTSAEHSGATYEVLYISDPFKSIRHHSFGTLERFLAEDAFGNGSTKSSNLTTCDEVCRIKSSLLEGLLVGIVLLIILISGLCCMMGIDTPTRFEAPQES